MVFNAFLTVSCSQSVTELYSWIEQMDLSLHSPPKEWAALRNWFFLQLAQWPIFQKYRVLNKGMYHHISLGAVPSAVSDYVVWWWWGAGAVLRLSEFCFANTKVMGRNMQKWAVPGSENYQLLLESWSLIVLLRTWWTSYEILFSCLF